MKDLYMKNKGFREYIDKYCEKHKIPMDVAFTHQIIKAIALIYETRTQKRSEGGTV